ncbi:TPA: hypothetical protein ACV5TO_003977, partial [Salmonella enterica]
MAIASGIFCSGKHFRPQIFQFSTRLQFLTPEPVFPLLSSRIRTLPLMHPIKSQPRDFMCLN